MFRTRQMLRSSREVRHPDPVLHQEESGVHESEAHPQENEQALDAQGLLPALREKPKRPADAGGRASDSAPPPPKAAGSGKGLLPGFRRRAAQAPSDDPLLQEAAAALPLSLSDPDSAEEQTEEGPALEVYTTLGRVAQSVFEAAAQKRAPDSGALMQALKQALDSFSEGEGLLSESVRQRSRGGGGTWAVRATNTAILSTRIGLEIGYDERRLLALGLCALMHDLGMSTIPEEVLKSPRLTPEQRQLLQNHPLESKKMVEAFGQEFAWIGAVVVQVHERRDGSGYPAALKDEQIHEFARIIGLADTYEAMSHPRADREACVTYNALSQIIDVRNSLFDPALIKALIQIVSIFPLGSLVKLNNGAIGRVIGVNKLYPTRPLMEMHISPQGRRLSPPKLLNLEEEPMLNIVDPAIEEAVLQERN